MSTEDAGHTVLKNSRPAVKSFAEFSCSSPDADTESSGGHKVTCTQLQYTYPVRTAFHGLVSSKTNVEVSTYWVAAIGAKPQCMFIPVCQVAFMFSH